jgi:hypothetical protein
MTDRRHVALDDGVSTADVALPAPWEHCLDIADGAGSAALPVTLESPQQMFDSLDGTEVWAAGRGWRVEVFSVVPDRAATWLQLRLTGPSDQMVTLKLGRGETAAMAVALLATWLAQPAPLPQILTAE